MTANWNQYICIGEFLLKHIEESSANEEMISRCVISRAYYAAYCIVRDAAAEKRIFTITGKLQDHANLREALKENSYSQIANGLNTLRIKRDEADYNGNEIFNCEDAQYCLELAKKICGLSYKI